MNKLTGQRQTVERLHSKYRVVTLIAFRTHPPGSSFVYERCCARHRGLVKRHCARKKATAENCSIASPACSQAANRVLAQEAHACTFVCKRYPRDGLMRSIAA